MFVGVLMKMSDGDGWSQFGLGTFEYPGKEVSLCWGEGLWVGGDYVWCLLIADMFMG